MTPTLSTAPSPPRSVYTLAQVDTLQQHAHRVVLYGKLLSTSLHDPGKDFFMEALLELVHAMNTDAAAVETLLAQGDRAAGKGGA